MTFVVYIPEGRYWVAGRGFSTYDPTTATQYTSPQQAQSVASRWNGAEVIKLTN
ncbi:hypothetical protein IT774_07565 [Salinimonas marina]|uniref:Uncharacterized protein n=1 Tax=Salinimonas marina TaxID=2785918 RepID=A0A7S9HEJ5_9ALTE|nr:hypothetical protein [Salinimonas marina]QPG06952.1 hypothetical protein IT774_07565 [Salinimonas marina]